MDCSLVNNFYLENIKGKIKINYFAFDFMRFYNPATGRFEGDFPDFNPRYDITIPSSTPDPFFENLKRRKQEETEFKMKMEEEYALGGTTPFDRLVRRRNAVSNLHTFYTFFPEKIKI